MSEIEDKIIDRWLAGQGLKGISRSTKIAPSRVREIIRTWSAEMVGFSRDERVAQQLGRLDAMLVPLQPRLKKGDVQAITAACKIINLKNLLLGIQQPNAPVVSVEVSAKPQTSTDRIEAALSALVSEQAKPEGETLQLQ